MPRPPNAPIHLRAARLLDVDKGEVLEPGELLVDGGRIVDVVPTSVPADAVPIDLGDLTLLPGLMDMEVNLLLGGPDHASPLTPVQDDPAVRTLRAVANARRTLRPGFMTVRNLGLSVQTGGRHREVGVVAVDEHGHEPELGALEAEVAGSVLAALLGHVDRIHRVACGSGVVVAADLLDGLKVYRHAVKVPARAVDRVEAEK